jgi:hypothetical protein
MAKDASGQKLTGGQGLSMTMMACCFDSNTFHHMRWLLSEN